jgi:hypothetical protein
LLAIAAEEAKVSIPYAHDEFPMSLLFALEHVHFERNRCVVVPLDWKIEEERLFSS